jgi:hypothetical protein
MADTLGEAIKFIGEKCWCLTEDALPTMSDLADAIEFCTRGVFKVEFSNEGLKYKDLEIKDLFNDEKMLVTIPNRGQNKKKEI